MTSGHNIFGTHLSHLDEFPEWLCLLGMNGVCTQEKEVVRDRTSHEGGNLQQALLFDQISLRKHEARGEIQAFKMATDRH